MVTQLRPKLHDQATKLLADADAAEDAVQDTLLKLWTMRDKLNDYEHPTSLALVMTRNRCLDMLRSASARTSAPLDYAGTVASDSPSPHRLLTAREAVAVAMKAMDKLPPSVAAIMKMRHVEGMETEEIARLIGATVESVRVGLSRGRRKMKEMIDHPMSTD